MSWTPNAFDGNSVILHYLVSNDNFVANSVTVASTLTTYTYTLQAAGHSKESQEKLSSRCHGDLLRQGCELGGSERRSQRSGRIFEEIVRNSYEID